MSVKCYYEVLGLDLNSTTEDIKKAYKKLALRCHPDKNLDNVEAAKKEFLLVHQAYEVLVDPQERAWYDKHRELILRGGLGKGDTYEDNSLNLFIYFRASCYKGFEDDSQGFYGVYAEVFKQIFEEEVEFLEQTPNILAAPEFGNSKSSYEEVVRPFYCYWEGYCTAKSYAWVEKYDTRQGSHRMERRYMEQENKKLRSKARKERNEEVRALVAFVKKRDLRVQEYNKLLQEKALERNKLAEERRAIEKRKRLEGMQQYQESGWASFSALSTELERLERAITAEFEDEYEEVLEETAEDVASGESGDNGTSEHPNQQIEDMNELDSLYCIACDKMFKSTKTMEDHKKSKKHLTNAALLIEEMKSQDAELLEEVKRGLSSADDTADQKQSKKSKKKKMKNVQEVQKTEAPPECRSSEQNDSNDVHQNTCTEEEVVGPDKPSKICNKMSKTKCSEDFVCNVCQAPYPTRNKLFEHIKSEGHALRVEPKDVQKTKDKKQKKKKSKH